MSSPRILWLGLLLLPLCALCDKTVELSEEPGEPDDLHPKLQKKLDEDGDVLRNDYGIVRPDDCDDDEKVAKGKYVSIHYTGAIDKSSRAGKGGEEFDSSHKKGKAFSFEVGQGHVIAGWDKGLIGMCKGGKALLIVPPEMGYGDKDFTHGSGYVIPARATLHFDVEVAAVSTEAPPIADVFGEIDSNKDLKLSGSEILAFFQRQGQDTIPPELMDEEDKDKDGFISWEEFGGPKGETTEL